MLGVATLGCVLGTVALGLVAPGDVALAIAAIVVSNLFFGIGFGEPIALKSFVSTYELPLDIEDDESVVRSPHSIVFTYFGRFGLLGAAWTAIFFWAIGQLVVRSVRAVREGVLSHGDLTSLLVALVILVTALFGVVMEGPMGGIPFWTFLGLAYGTLRRNQQEALEAAGAEPEQSAEAREVRVVRRRHRFSQRGRKVDDGRLPTAP